LNILLKLFEHPDRTVILHAARTIELMGNAARGARPAMQALFDRFEHEPGDPAWFIRFTTTGFLSRIDKSSAPVNTPD